MEVIGKINNMEICKHVDEFMGENECQLVSGFRLDQDGVAISNDTWNFLSKQYGFDVEIIKPRNKHCENWQTSLSERYDLVDEEVRLLIMQQHPHTVKGITIFDRHG